MAKTGFAVKLLLIFSLFILVFPFTPVTASLDETGWSRVNIPTEGKAGDWVLADGSDVVQLAAAIDGTLYAGVENLTYTLYRSTD